MLLLVFLCYHCIDLSTIIGWKKRRILRPRRHALLNLQIKNSDYDLKVEESPERIENLPSAVSNKLFPKEMLETIEESSMSVCELEDPFCSHSAFLSQVSG